MNQIFLILIVFFGGHLVAEAHDTGDFFISYAPPEESLKAFSLKAKASVSGAPTFPSRETCLKHVRDALCETDADMARIQKQWNKLECVNPHANEYVAVLAGVYDELPAPLQESFCTLRKIFVSDNIYSVAFASAIREIGPNATIPVGGYIGLRRGTLEHQPSSQNLVSWKEQLNLGGSKDFLANDPRSIQVDYGIQVSHLPADGLYYAIVHELGHLIDLNNPQLNSYRLVNGAYQPNSGTFGSLSWESYDVPLASATYPFRESFCYYKCIGTSLNFDQAYAAYQSMAQSSFITAYSAVNLMEDFAEFFAWYIVRANNRPSYRIRVPGHPELNMGEMIQNNPKQRQKFEFIELAWRNPVLRVRNGL